MPITTTDRIVALIGHLSRDDVEALPPAERRQLAGQCRHVAKPADGQPQPQAGLPSQPQAGLLSAAQTRPRDE